MSVIPATSRRCKTLADGTLQLIVEIEPRDAQDAFQLFGMPDVPMALAKLTQEASQQAARVEAIEAAKPKGGALAKLAGMWCNIASFYNFIRPVYDRLMGGDGFGFGDLGDHVDMTPPEICRHAILVMCDIQSRAELDNNPEAAEKFHRLISEPYAKWFDRR